MYVLIGRCREKNGDEEITATSFKSFWDAQAAMKAAYDEVETGEDETIGHEFAWKLRTLHKCDYDWKIIDVSVTGKKQFVF